MAVIRRRKKLAAMRIDGFFFSFFSCFWPLFQSEKLIRSKAAVGPANGRTQVRCKREVKETERDGRAARQDGEGEGSIVNSRGSPLPASPLFSAWPVEISQMARFLSRCIERNDRLVRPFPGHTTPLAPYLRVTCHTTNSLEKKRLSCCQKFA